MAGTKKPLFRGASGVARLFEANYGAPAPGLPQVAEALLQTVGFVPGPLGVKLEVPAMVARAAVGAVQAFAAGAGTVMLDM
jgi:hypothetical protein